MSLNDKRIISSNNAIFPSRCQQLNKEELQSFLQDPAGYLESQSPGALKMLNVLLYLSKAYNIVAPSQEKLAYLIGVGRQWANVIIKRLVQAGLLVVKYRHRRTCVYKISKLFYDPIIRSKIAHFFTALNGFKRALGMQKKVDTTPIIYKVSYLFKTTLSNYQSVNKQLKKETLLQFESQPLHPLGEEAMQAIRSINDFTPEQQEELRQQYNQQVLIYAIQHTANKQLLNPFGYFKKICEARSNIAGNPSVGYRMRSDGSEGLNKNNDHKGGMRQFTSPYIPQPKVERKVNANPVEEYYRVEILRDTPKYKRAIHILRYHPENPFAKNMTALQLPLECDPVILDRMKLREVRAHENGQTHCEYNTKPSEPCAFVEACQDGEWVAAVKAANANHDARTRTIMT